MDGWDEDPEVMEAYWEDDERPPLWDSVSGIMGISPRTAELIFSA